MGAARIDSKFCLDKGGNLKTTHQYYTQLQLEIHVNHLLTFGVKVGDLCVYTNKCVHIVEDIKYDKDYVEQLLGKCDSFFHSYLLPAILTRSLDRIDSESEIDEEGSAQPLFCICNKPEFGKMNLTGVISIKFLVTMLITRYLRDICETSDVAC